MHQNFKIGDWVNSYSKGIYRIERIIQGFYDESERSILFENKIGDAYEDLTMVSKRLLNSKLKKDISYESCSESFISHIDKKQFSQLQEILKGNPGLIAELDAYKIPTLTTVHNSQLQIDNNRDLQTVKQLIEFVKTGKTFFEIENEMKRLDIKRLVPKNFGNYDFQLFNFDEEYKDKRKVWRDSKLTKIM